MNLNDIIPSDGPRSAPDAWQEKPAAAILRQSLMEKP
jgi:hypothetical protein